MSPPSKGAVLAGSIIVLGAATAALAVASDGNVGAAIAPVLGVALLYSIWKAPLRWTASLLLVALLVIDVATDFQGNFHTPLHIIGDLLVLNFDMVVRGTGVKFNGLEAVLLLTLAVTVHRKATGSTIDSRGQVQTAGVISGFVLIWFAGVAWGTINGVLHNGTREIIIWQARPLLHYVLLFFLMQAAYRGPKDHVLLGNLFVFCATLKAALAIYIRYRVLPSFNPMPETATSHSDSILFVMACMVLLTHLAERTDRRRLLNCVLFMPLILWGMVANMRRLAWVELAMSCLAVYAVSPWSKWRRSVARAAVVLVPLTALYLAAGWESDSAIFIPAQTLRSVVDSKADRSTFSRDLENWNLVASIQERPFTGRGFGHEYSQAIPGDDLSSVFPMYKALPHNSVLGLLLFAGVFAFAALWSLFGVVVFLAVRSYHRATLPEDRAAALCCLAAMVIVTAQCYGDIGVFATQSKILMALGLTVAGKLAVATGAWPARLRKKGHLPVPSLEASVSAP